MHHDIVTHQRMSPEPVNGNPAIIYLMRLSKRSRRTMKGCLRRTAHILGYATIESCCWNQLRREHVLAIIESLVATDAAPATINLYLAAIRGVAGEAWNAGLMDTDSYQRIVSIKGVRGSRLPTGRALKKTEITALFAACDEDGTAKARRDAAILAVALGCGLRRTEIAGLGLRSLDREESAFTLVGKGNKERKAFLPPAVGIRLDDWLLVRGEEPGALFNRIRRHDRIVWGAMTDQAIYYILKQRQKQAGIQPFSPHDLRRTYASMLLENNEDIITVKDAMGHASVATTQRYDKRGESRLKEAAGRLGASW